MQVGENQFLPKSEYLEQFISSIHHPPTLPDCLPQQDQVASQRIMWNIGRCALFAWLEHHWLMLAEPSLVAKESAVLTSDLLGTLLFSLPQG